MALYFALEYLIENRDAKPTDSVVWVLSPHELNELENVEGVGSFTPSIASGSCKPLIKGAFYEKIEPDKIIAAMAEDHDLRIFIQQGCFTIHASRIPINRRPANERYLLPLLVPAHHARRIAEQLFMAGFRKGDIYPDLTNLASELVETHKYFSP